MKIDSHRLNFQKLSILVHNEYQLTSKQVNFYNLDRLYPSFSRLLSSTTTLESRYLIQKLH